MEKIIKMLLKKFFNVLKSTTETVVEFYKAGLGIVLTDAEKAAMEKIISVSEEVEASTAKVLANLGYARAYEEAQKDLEKFWEDFMADKHLMKDTEKKKLKSLQDRVYQLRGIADSHDPDLKQARRDWMQMFPLNPEKFEKYAGIMGVQKGTPEYEHARLMTPAKLISLLNQEEAAEARQEAEEDYQEVDRSDWADFDARGYDSRTKDKEKENPDNYWGELNKKILDAFKWLEGIDSSWDLDDIAMALSSYDALFTGDIVKDKLDRLAIKENWIFEKLLLTEDRIKEYFSKFAERATWRAEVDKGNIPSFEWDLYHLQFGKQRNLFWKELGGLYKSIWGTLLRFEAVKDLPDNMVEMCKNIICYDDSTKDTPATVASYKGVHKILWDNVKLRKKSTDAFKAQKAEWEKKAVKLMVQQNDKFCMEVALLEGKKLPKDNYNPTWNDALLAQVEVAKTRVAEKAKDIVMAQQYSKLDDFYGDDKERVALLCLQEIGKQAKIAATAQTAFIGDRTVLDFVEDEGVEF